MKTIKVLAGSLAAITVGATLALGIFAAPITSLGDYVKVSGSALNSPVIVIGDGATAGSGFAQDVVGAADIAAAVAGYATTSVSTGAVGMGVSGGAEIGTTNTRLYLGDALAKDGVKSTLTKSDLPTLLASGTMTDAAGATYAYDQYITLASGTVTFGNSNADLADPATIITLDTNAGGPGVLNYSVTFNKLLNVSSSDVRNKKLKLLGADYSIGSESLFDGTTNKLVLYGSSLTQTISGGEEKKITVDNVEYTVKLLGVTLSSATILSVNGETQSLNKNTNAIVAGLSIYTDDAFYLSSTDQTQNSAKLSFGSNKLTLTNGSLVSKGAGDGTTIPGTLVALQGSVNSGISKIDIAMAAKDNSHDYVDASTPFVDPVFGAFKLAFGGFAGGSTETLTIDNSGGTAASIKFTDYRGAEKTLTWAYTGSSAFAPSLNSTSTITYVVVENQTVKKNDYVLLTPTQESEFSHVMQYTSASNLGSSNAYIELKDAMSDVTSRFYLTNTGSKTGDMYIDGQVYHAALVTTTTDGAMSFTWGTGSAVNTVGSDNKVTVFPLVKTSKGGWVTLASNTTSVPILGASTVLELPGGTATVANSTTAGSETLACGGTTTTLNAATAGQSVVCAPTGGRLAYNITVNNATNTIGVVPVMGTSQIVYPAVIFREENAKDVSTPEVDVKDFVVTTVGQESGTGITLKVVQPNLTATTTSGFVALTSDASVSKTMDRRGTVVTFDTDGQGLVGITYPDEQAVATVAVGAGPTFGAGAAGTVQQAIKITSPIGKLASEVVNNPAPGADLILVGGPCANSLVAKLLSSSNVTCDSWNYTTGIIKEVIGGFTDGSRALIVAGTLAKDTRDLAKMLIQGTLTYAV